MSRSTLECALLNHNNALLGEGMSQPLSTKINYGGLCYQLNILYSADTLYHTKFPSSTTVVYTEPK